MSEERMLQLERLIYDNRHCKPEDVNASEAVRTIWQAAKRQDVERIAELERKRASAEFLNKMRHKPYADTDAGLVAQIDELRAKLEALEKQEPAAWVSSMAFGSQVTFYKPVKPANWDNGDSDEEYYCRPLYAKPVPAAPAIPEENAKLKAEVASKQTEIDALQAEIVILNYRHSETSAYQAGLSRYNSTLAQENENLKHQHSNDEAANRMLSDACTRLNARVDALMLEYCSEEMTPVQITEWARHQQPVEPKEVYSVHTVIG